MPLGIAPTAYLPEWWQRAGPIVATGGNISTITDNGNTYTLHTFSTVGTDTFRVVSGSGSVDMFVLAGGGPGGQATSGGAGFAYGTGGGGAGYLAIGMADSSVDNFGARSVSVGTFSVVVGNGGNRAAGQYFGGNSSVFGVVAEGGGSGGITDYIPASPAGAGYGWGIPGGCGGGASPTYSSLVIDYNEGGVGTQGQDGGRALNYDAGEGPPSQYGGGGGGGIFDTGSAGFTGNPTRGEGGDGRESSFNGVATYYGGGGGGGVPYRSSGGVDYFGGDPGLGGGGTGGCPNAPSGAILPTAGANNTGGGGGGGYFSTVGANGGSGLVMIRYLAT